MKNASFYESLHKALKKDTRLIDEEGDIIRNAVIDKALKYDEQLLSMLLADKSFKDTFFRKVGDSVVFLHNVFIDYIQDKNFLIDSYTKYKNKIGLTIDGKYLNERGEVSLVWPFKDCVLEGGQSKEEQKRKEIFFNEVLAKDEIDRLFEPKVLTGLKRYTKEGEEKVAEINRDESGTIRENLIIKGNNLLALHSLKKEFAGKVKLIYIDPPYNTGGSEETFTYNNNFNHSTWLTFMSNRLVAAKYFLREDGFIAITIDHVELFYLGALCDEVFGSSNRIGIVTIVHKPEGRNQEKFFGTSNEFMLVYAKNKDRAHFEKVILDDELKERFEYSDEKGRYRLKNFIRLSDGKYSLRENKPHFYYPIYVSHDFKYFSLTKDKDCFEVFPITEQGIERTWKTTKETFIDRANNGDIVAKQKEGRIELYEKLREDQVIKTHWIKKNYHAYHFGTKLLEETIGRKAFSFPKSLYAVIDVLKLMTSGQDIILDFFAGSGTIAHAVFELNKEDKGKRQFILIEQLDEHIEICLDRTNHVLKNQPLKMSYIYSELKKYNEGFIESIQDAKTTKELLSIWEDMKVKGMVDWRLDWKKFNESLAEFKAMPLDKQKKTLVELLDKNALYVPLADINDRDFEVSKEDKALNKQFYG